MAEKHYTAVSALRLETERTRAVGHYLPHESKDQTRKPTPTTAKYTAVNASLQ